MNNSLNRNPAYVLQCQRLTKIFQEGPAPVEILRNIELSISPAEKVAIIGASGSGKSTLLHLLGGLDTPTSGKIYVAGKVMTALNEGERSRMRNNYLGFIYQFHHLLPEFTALENVCLPLLMRALPLNLVKDKAQTLLTRVGLAKRLQHKLSELSGGERQRVAIARALVNDPVCVLADEPTGNLDQYNAQQIYELMLELNELLGTSFVIVTHDSKLAKKMQRTLLLENGELHTITQ